MWIYTNVGTIFGVPARDLTDEEGELYADAIAASESACGRVLYQRPPKPKQSRQAPGKVEPALSDPAVKAEQEPDNG